MDRPFSIVDRNPHSRVGPDVLARVQRDVQLRRHVRVRRGVCRSVPAIRALSIIGAQESSELALPEPLADHRAPEHFVWL